MLMDFVRNQRLFSRRRHRHYTPVTVATWHTWRDILIGGTLPLTHPVHAHQQQLIIADINLFCCDIWLHNILLVTRTVAQLSCGTSMSRVKCFTVCQFTTLLILPPTAVLAYWLVSCAMCVNAELPVERQQWHVVCCFVLRSCCSCVANCVIDMSCSQLLVWIEFHQNCCCHLTISAQEHHSQ